VQDTDWSYGKTNKKLISKFIEIFMNKKKRKGIKPGDANVDEDSLLHFIKHIVCIYETERATQD
jgi:hypothetical protein